MKAATNWSLEHGYEEMEVVTQGGNQGELGDLFNIEISYLLELGVGV